MSRPVAVVAAPLREEIAPFLSRIGARLDRRDAGLSVHRGDLEGNEVVAAVLGDGARRAEQGLERLLATVTPERLLLVGVAGGLSPDLTSGSLVAAGTLVSGGGERLPVARGKGLTGIPDATIATARTVVGTVEEKRALWQRVGRPELCVVDLESWVVANRLERAACPFSIVRAVSDAADDDLPLDFAASSDEGGHVDRTHVLTSLLRRPQALGGLLRLRSRVRECARSLAEAADRWVLSPHEGESGRSVC